MIKYVSGDIFKSDSQVITNAVNCVGVMGKGIALEFQNRFPGLFSDYRLRCNRGEVLPGRPYIWQNDRVQILNFPTKRHWSDKSRLEDIESGLIHLANSYTVMGISSIAMPALGCGLGGLAWSEVKPLFDKYLKDIPDLEVTVYLPR